MILFVDREGGWVDVLSFECSSDGMLTVHLADGRVLQDEVRSFLEVDEFQTEASREEVDVG